MLILTLPYFAAHSARAFRRLPRGMLLNRRHKYPTSPCSCTRCRHESAASWISSSSLAPRRAMLSIALPRSVVLVNFGLNMVVTPLVGRTGGENCFGGQVAVGRFSAKPVALTAPLRVIRFFVHIPSAGERHVEFSDVQSAACIAGQGQALVQIADRLAVQPFNLGVHRHRSRLAQGRGAMVDDPFHSPRFLPRLVPRLAACRLVQPRPNRQGHSAECARLLCHWYYSGGYSRRFPVTA